VSLSPLGEERPSQDHSGYKHLIGSLGMKSVILSASLKIGSFKKNGNNVKLSRAKLLVFDLTGRN
jgi:hypothetical protein